MRTLTLTRKKCFCMCFYAVKIYLSCPPEEATDDFNDIPCKKVGKLRNGRSVSYEIGEEETVIFVAYSDFSPSLYHAKYVVPAGTENVALMTKPKLDLLAGNPFSIYPAE